MVGGEQWAKFMSISMLIFPWEITIGNDIKFIDVAIPQGLTFEHDHGGSGERYYIETIGPGVCLFDYDNDDDLDIYFCQGSGLPGWDKDIILENKLYRNDGNKWTDVTSSAGVGDRSYSMGCACGDVDNDGFTDLYVTNFGKDILYQNKGDGTFMDVTDISGINNPLWGASVAFFDMDADGLLDIYVSNYVEYSLDNNPWCGDRRKGLRDYCKPDFFPGVEDLLFKNNGDWTFKDVSSKSGIEGRKGKGLGVIPADFDLDGDSDLYVANDGVMNHYFINDGSGYFEENAIFTGLGFNDNGLPEAGMGVDIGDVNGDGWPDIFVTNFSGESNTIYMNNKRGYFKDETFMSGLDQPSLDYVGFGTKLLDLDYDGWLDLFVVNGHVAVNINDVYKKYTHAQRKQIFLNKKDGTFKEFTSNDAGDIGQPSVGRGAAFGDLDNDGDLDVVIANNNGQANLLLRDGSPQKEWLGLLLVGGESNMDAIGARVTLETDGSRQTKFINTAGSYMASNDKRLIFGLGDEIIVKKIEVIWPSGKKDFFENVKTKKYYRILEGESITAIDFE